MLLGTALTATSVSTFPRRGRAGTALPSPTSAASKVAAALTAATARDDDAVLQAIAVLTNIGCATSTRTGVVA